jgi:hypothetical protein
MNKTTGNFKSTFINLATYDQFEKKLFADYPRLEFIKFEDNNINKIYKKIFLDNADWIGYKNELIYTLDSSYLNGSVIQISRGADFYYTFALNFENCNKDVISKIEFLYGDKVIEEISSTWIDIYRQMYSTRIESDNNLLIPSYHLRNYVPIIIPLSGDNYNSIRFTLNKQLESDQKIHLYTKYCISSGARRTQISKSNLGMNFYIDRTFSKVYQPTDKNILNINLKEFWDICYPDKESLSALSEIFISVRKKGVNFKEEIIKNISLEISETIIYDNQSLNFFKNINPLLNGLTTSKDNNNFQGHYLIPFSNKCQQENIQTEWKYRGAINMNKIDNMSLKLELNETVSKESYEIEITYVCPTLFTIQN